MGDTTAGGAAAPAPSIYDFDGFDNSAATVAALHARGQHVICYIDVGTWENWRSDAHKFPGSVLGNDNGWPGERWLDIRQLRILEPIMTARFQMCRAKRVRCGRARQYGRLGERHRLLRVTARDQPTTSGWPERSTRLGMAVFQKNSEQAATLEPYFDGVIEEQCLQYQECAISTPTCRPQGGARRRVLRPGGQPRHLLSGSAGRWPERGGVRHRPRRRRAGALRLSTVGAGGAEHRRCGWGCAPSVRVGLSTVGAVWLRTVDAVLKMAGGPRSSRFARSR